MNIPADNPASQETPILIVEDSLIQAELLRRVLAREGYRVILAKDGAEGLTVARKELPKVIISDINMPEMNGFELCKAIRNDAALKDTPVILLTMLSDARDVIHGVNAGADYYVTKPFNEPFLLSKIRDALARPPAHDEEKMKMEIYIGEEKFPVNAGRQQVMTLLVSTYENAVLQNCDLMNALDQLKKLDASLENRTREIEETNKNLESFAYSVSHDLRTPLRAIDGFSQQVLKRYADKLDDEGKRYLNLVSDNANRMNQLIGAILIFSRTGRQGMSMAEVNMEGLVRDVYEEQMTAAAGRKPAVKIQPLAPTYGDHAMLRQVWANLLSNAIKFTAKKTSAAVQIGSYVEGEEQVYFVKDNGAGFDMQYAGKLFDLFQRLHREEDFEGTGVGLAIVKLIIARHGGRVWAEARVGEGATFYFALPLRGRNA